MKATIGPMTRTWIAALAACAVLATAACSSARAQPAPEDKPKPPKSVEVETYVIMASMGTPEHVDPSLKEVAELLKKRFKDVFNRFRRHNRLTGDVKLEKTADFALIDNYHLKVTYNGVKDDAERGRMIMVSWRLVRTTEVEEEGKATVKETTVAGPFNVNVIPGSFFLFGGPEVNQETMILAIRVLK